MPFGGTIPFGGGLHSPASRNHQASSLVVCIWWYMQFLLEAVGSTRLGSWFGGMFGPLHVGPNDCVLQRVTLGNHLLEQKAKTTAVNPAGPSASNSLLRRCVLTAFHVCLLNPLSGLLWARFGFHHEIDDMARNTLPGSHSSSLLDFKQAELQAEFCYHHSLGHGGKPSVLKSGVLTGPGLNPLF